LSEAQKHGFKVAIMPKGNAPKKPIKGLEIVAVEYLHQALSYMAQNT
jgi:DNA repair protein RadA/Sms